MYYSYMTWLESELIRSDGLDRSALLCMAGEETLAYVEEELRDRFFEEDHLDYLYRRADDERWDDEYPVDDILHLDLPCPDDDDIPF